MEPGREGGTWVGLVKKNYPENGKASKYCFSCLTNIPSKVDKATGRGMLIIDYLEGENSFPVYIKQLRNNGLVYNGFNLIGVELRQALYFQSSAFVCTWRNCTHLRRHIKYLVI